MTSLAYSLLSPVLFPLFLRKIRSLQGTDHLPQRGGYIIAANHIDWLDGFYIVALVDRHRHVPTFFLTRSNNYWWTGIAAQIPNDRSTIIDVAVERLQRGDVICNFPEGIRNAATTLAPGKTGTVRMAAEAGVPVIPMGITCDAGRNMGKSIQFLLSPRHPVDIVIGEPLRFTPPSQNITPEWLEAETKRLMSTIAHLAHKTL